MDTTIQYYGTGRRKRARARVFLRPGKGAMTVNSRALDDYFPNGIHRMAIQSPLTLTETGDAFDALITVRGGGISAQAEAIRHGLARALVRYNPELRPPIKDAGMLTRDAREVERKKYGQPGARKRFQFSKR
ncbi:MAG: 30S ribosomal protein S9 [Acidobacteriota bacterium]